jgi:hypothetical protein
MSKLGKLILLLTLTGGCHAPSSPDALSRVSLACVGRTAEAGRPPPEGLTLIAASARDGLVGAFRQDERVVYFRAQRLGINAEWFLPGNTEKYAVAAELFDRNCHAYYGNGNAPGWQPAKRGVLSALSADEAAPHQADMGLTGATLDALKAALSPEMSPELGALVIPGACFRSRPVRPPGQVQESSGLVPGR